jgi:hypothetical protein
LVDAAVVSSIATGDWQEQPTAIASTEYGRGVAAPADAAVNNETWPAEEEEADRNRNPPRRRREMMANVVSCKKRWLNTCIVVLAIIFSMALALIGICEAPGSGDRCHHRRKPTPVVVGKANPPPAPLAFAFVVHYEGNAELQCLEPVSIRMMVLGENNDVTGVSGKNATCAHQASCFLNPKSNTCTSLQRLDPIPVYWGIHNATGAFVECDQSDEDLGQKGCGVKAPGCGISSVYPSCVKDAYTIQELIDNPIVIQRDNRAGVEPFSYLLLYSDRDCQSLQGLRSFVEGPQDVVLAADTAAEVSCEDSLVCLSNPTGPKCRGLGFNKTQTIVTNVTDDDQVIACDANGDCSSQLYKECTVSFVPGCYQRWPSAKVLFSNPSAFVG